MSDKERRVKYNARGRDMGGRGWGGGGKGRDKREMGNSGIGDDYTGRERTTVTGWWQGSC